MKRFAYARDPLCLAACAAYVLNRWCLKPHLHFGWSHSWFNDALLIPAALPIVLAVQRRLGLRRHDDPPTTMEIFAHLVGGSILFEWIGPHIASRATGDPWDVVAYSIGALAAGCWWRTRRMRGVA